MPLTAEALEREYGAELARPPLSDAKSPHLLVKLLKERGIDTSRAAAWRMESRGRLAPLLEHPLRWAHLSTNTELLVMILSTN